MKLVEYVPDYILRDLPLKVGMTVTILADSVVHVQINKEPEPFKYDYILAKDIEVKLTNFLPGYTEVYRPVVHNHQVVWIADSQDGEPLRYHSTDINNVKEVREHA